VRVIAADPIRNTNSVTDYFRCAEVPYLGQSGPFGTSKGFFRFGSEVVCYGQSIGKTRTRVTDPLYDASQDVQANVCGLLLPFDLTQVIDNLRYESYVRSSNRLLEKRWIKDLYYRLRPMLPVGIRKHLQGLYLRDWDRIAFPRWPVDRSVDVLLEKILVLAMKKGQIERLPFVWFWPDGHSACAIMTHDVETSEGRDFSGRIMDIDDEFGIKASFQIVPEKRYAVPDSYLEGIRERGFEINVQGLDHDGNLFQNRETFLESARRINQHARRYDARGFRSPILYRNSHWFQDMHFSYDMSVPNVAHLEAQRGGCCTVMPYSLPGGPVGMTELPVTMTEDYTLFHVLKDYSTSLWEQQMSIILAGHGLMNFIIHPDYVTTGRAQDTFMRLLEMMSRLRSDNAVWIPLPRDVDQWWRERNQMSVVHSRNEWKVEGPGSERATVAFACIEGDHLRYEFKKEASCQRREVGMKSQVRAGRISL
jgi:peptidoglycan/xylan/chitin deacetylase (PgdA/CDA1 family)